MVRNVDAQTRKKAVLSVAINRYINDAQPVSSENIAQHFNLSSATIRNIFAELENEGYLTHPYTSAGRMPTGKGYRYYVDSLFCGEELVCGEKEHIEEEYRLKNTIQELEEILDNTSELISEVTRNAGITYFSEWQDKFFYKGISLIINQPEFQDLEKIRLLIRLLEERGHLLSVINRELDDEVRVYIGDELECPQVLNCSLVVSSYRVKNKPSGRIAVLGPMRMQYQQVIPALEYISEMLSDALSDI